MGFFGTRRFLDEDDEAWQIETWQWMLREFGGTADLRRSPFVLPTREFFPPGPDTGRARAEHVFQTVKKLARMEDWPCELIDQPRRAELRVADLGSLKPITSPPGGTFLIRDGVAQISYDPSDLEKPINLIATFAHELAHYRLSRVPSEPPGGHDLHEFATDLCAVYLGFGVFAANSAFNFKQANEFSGSSWQYQRSGYLSQRALVFALAIFLKLRGQKMDAVGVHMKDYLYTDLSKAWKYLGANDSPMKPLQLG